LWVMPVGAEVLDTDGDQLWYATDEGSGSVTSLGVGEFRAATIPPLTGPTLVKFDEPWPG
jgi:hypothetical protein